MRGQICGVVLALSLAGCGAIKQQQTAQIMDEAKAHLQAIAQTCEQEMQAEHGLDPIRNKIELIRPVLAGAPPPAMLADRSRPTAEEKIAIAKWQTIREACVQKQIQYGLSLSLPPNLQPLRDKLVLDGRQTSERTGLLVAALYDGRMTYGQFAADRLKVTDQALASLTGEASRAPAEEPNVSLATPASSTGAEEIPLKKVGSTYLLPVAVNGLPPMFFMLDSGSSSVALPAEVVLTLLRTGTLQKSDFIGSESFVMADGRELPSITFKIRELRVGQHVIRDVEGNANPALTQPLLGGSFLSRFASWSIDNRRNALVLSR